MSAVDPGVRHDERVRFEVETVIPAEFGRLRVRGYRDLHSGVEHLALIADPLGDAPIVRVHSECLTGEALGSLKCECGPQLREALATVGEHGGIVIYMRGHEGRGIGLIDKLRAYRLQESGLDTLDANEALGLPVDARRYDAAAAMLADLGVDSIRLLTNNPDKVRQLRSAGIEVAERLPLVIRQGADSDGYLDAKRDRLGHLID